MITVSNLKKSYDETAVFDSLSMQVKRGSIYGLVGPNGSGKTTLLRMMAGVLRPDAGAIELDGEAVYENDKVKARIGFIADEFWFPFGETLTGMQSMYKGFYPNFNDRRFHDMVTFFELPAKRRMNTFSKGMKKQAAFCLVLAAEPDVLLLDEPLDGLDPLIRKYVLKQMMDLVAEKEMTVLVSSHNLRELEGICDTVGILADGKMLLERELEDLHNDFCKVQVAFDPETRAAIHSGAQPDPYKALNVLWKESRGNVDLLLVRGARAAVEENLKAAAPVILDPLPLTLEEVFIYELGGDDREISSLIF
ncbi:MAG: ABC transporter ATP-binding protein [Clostridia bacterium]|nr:ABC transporter ATP-binding protein [Clostridia bacterium]